MDNTVNTSAANTSEGNMGRVIKDYPCGYDNTAGLTVSVGKELGLSFPETYYDSDAIVKMVLAQKEKDGAPFAEITLGRCLEAETLGADVRIDDSEAGPMINDYKYNKVEELLDMPAANLDHPRLQAILGAARKLSAMDVPVMIEIAGPITILSFLMKTPKLFKGIRKSPEVMAQVLEKLGNDIIAIMEAAKAAGVNIINYSDSVGGVNILGPELAAEMVRIFTKKMALRMRDLSDEKTMVIMCPKTTLALIGTGNARFENVKMDKPMRYGEAILAMRRKGRMAGHMCIKKVDYVLSNGLFKEVVLL
ncbi:MAG: uroporphyrinogen decarboxylase family protein [Lachnospiraceae bacterium]|nr:uroporphyrinogen decarboxylase family protein [Lachnospiraceae bacterium]